MRFLSYYLSLGQQHLEDVTMIFTLPLLHLEVLVEQPGSLTQSSDWVRPQVSEEDGVTFLSVGPWEVAWCWLSEAPRRPTERQGHEGSSKGSKALYGALWALVGLLWVLVYS